MSIHDVACITQCHDKFFGKHTYRLHMINAGSMRSRETILHHIKPKKLLVINDEHVAVVGEQKKNNDGQIFVKIYNTACKMIKEVILEQDIYNNYIDVAPNGRLVTCSRAGEISIHHIFTLAEKLKNETESVFAANNTLPTALVSMVTDYAGFFSGDSRMPKDTYQEIEYPEERSGLFSRLRAKF